MSYEYSDEHSLGFDDFKDAKEVERLCHLSFEDEDEVAVEIIAIVNPYVAARLHPVERSHPEEGGDCEELQVLYGEGNQIDLYDHLTDRAREILEEKILEESRSYDEDMQDAALEDRWDGVRDRDLLEDN